MNAAAQADYNFAYLDEQTKRMIRRAILKGVAIPGYQVPFASREMPMPYGWGTGGIQVTAACLVPVSYTHLDVYKRQLSGWAAALWVMPMCRAATRRMRCARRCWMRCCRRTLTARCTPK